MATRFGAAAVGATALTLALSSAAAAGPEATGPASPARAGTSVTIGQVASFPNSFVCDPAPTVVQAVSAGPSYTVPAGGGVITSYSHNANVVAGQVRVVAFTPGAGGTWTLVGKSTLATVTVNTLNTFATRIPVPAGAQLGLQTTNTNMSCAFNTGDATDLAWASGTFDPDTQNTMTPTPPFDFSEFRANISAVVESDADHDGFGDVSQDACPESASTQATCPVPDACPELASTQAACPVPDTIVTKKPAKTSTNQYAKIKFHSTVPGSTFKCSLDGKKFKPCSSQYTKRLALGKHKVKIQATSPLGLVEATPAKVKFKIVAPH